jgi:MFS family permease
MESRRRRARLPRVRVPFRSEPDPAQLATPLWGGVAGSATPDIAPKRFAESLRAFQHRNYRLFYAGQSVSLIGTWMQTIAQAWLVLQITNSEVALGVVTMLQFLPIMLFVLFAGVIADRVPKRNFLVLTQSVAMVQALILAALVFTGEVHLWHVYVLALMLGFANAFDMPTRQAFAIEMVGREDLINAVALNSGMFNGARLIGPAIAGFIIAAFGVETVFLLNGLSFIAVILSLLAIRQSELYKIDRRGPAGNPLRELKDGLQYSLRTPSILLIVIIVAVIGTFGYNFTVMLPLVDRFVLHKGSVTLGFLTAAVGLGSLVAAVLLAGRKKATRYQLFTGITAFTLLLGGVALSTNVYVSLACLVGIGAAGTTWATTANTSLQIAAPDEMRGRVVSLYMLLFAGSTPIGGYLLGFLASTIGTREAIGLFAGLCGVGVVLGVAYYTLNKAAVQRSSEAPRARRKASA